MLKKLAKYLKTIIHKPFLLALLIQTIFLLVFLGITIFIGNGYAVFVDVTEGIRLEDTFNRHFSTFDDNWGQSLAEKQRIVPFAIIWGLYKILGLSVSNFVPFRLLICYLFTLAGFLIGIKLILQSHGHTFSNKRFLLALLISSSIYIYNPWMTNRIMHLFLFITSFTVPVFIGLTYNYFFTKSKNDVYKPLLTGLLLGWFTTTPHTITLVIIPGIILAIIALLSKEYLKLFKYLIIVPIVMALTGAFWIFPFINNQFILDRVESTTILDLLSKNASIINTLKLQGYWWNDLLPSYTFNTISYLKGVINIIYILPLAFIPLLFVNKSYLRIKLFIIAIFVIAIFLSSKTNISRELYIQLMFGSKTQSMGWLFRDIEKIAYLIGLIYAISSLLVLISTKRKFLNVTVPAATIIISIYLGYTYLYLNRNMSKVHVPSDYSQLNELLLKDDTQYNVAFYPKVQFVSWADRIDSANYIANLSTVKPIVPLTVFDSQTAYYLDYILDGSRISAIDVASALDMIGVKYLAIRTDRDEFDSGYTVSELKKKDYLKLVLDMEYLKVFENKRFVGLLDLYDSTIVTNLGLDSLKYLSVLGLSYNRSHLEFSDQNYIPDLYPEENTSYLIDSEGFTDIAMSQFKDDFVYPGGTLINANPSDNWARASLTDKTHAETSLYFKNKMIDGGQFNYGHEVALSLGGVIWDDDGSSELMEIKFPEQERFGFGENNGSLEINYRWKPTESLWEIYRSNKFDLGGTKAIGISGKTNFGNLYAFHMRISYYDADGKVLDEYQYTPFESSKVQFASKIPSKAQKADISVLLRGLSKGGVDGKITDLKFYKIISDLQVPTLDAEVTNNCLQNCRLMARILKSPNYLSSIEFTGEGFSGKIVNTSTSSKYVWHKITDVESQKSINVSIKNLENINSVASLVVVDALNLETLQEKIRNEIEKKSSPIQFEDRISYYTSDTNIRPISSISDYVKYSNTSYSFTLNNIQGKTALVFKKPMDNFWIISSKKNNNLQIGSISNIWTVDEDGSYNISYKPQKYFLFGLKLSATFLLFIFFLGGAIILRRVKYTKYK